MQSSLLEVRNLTKVFGGGLFSKERTVALDDFSIAVPNDKPLITTIAGESGSGKTTLANLILGFLTPTSGEIVYKGKNLWDMSRDEWFTFRTEVQAIFQDPFEAYNPFYMVDHVFERTIKRFRLAKNQSEGRRMTIEALETVGLRRDEVLGKYPHQLSGGQRQRVMVARAFLLRPRLVVADEPVSMIDASLQARVLDIILSLKEEFGISFLYITHDLSTAYQISDDIFVLYLGSVMERGSIDAVIQNPQHPYTQLLVSSVPIPDPTTKWQERLELPSEEEMQTGTMEGCKYYPRCPQAMDMCLVSTPPLCEVGPDHYAACYLYGGQVGD